ncbi:MAG: hypothetical protein F9K49_05460 [Caedimonadaceae bacterium]|nr:MAG: hypothetical protein F9K49_05460 [Caedimonadaceae bacterium]
MSVIDYLHDDYRSLLKTLDELNSLIEHGTVKCRETKRAWLNKIKISLRIYLYARSGLLARFSNLLPSKIFFNSQIQSNYRLIEAITGELSNPMPLDMWTQKAFILKKFTEETLKHEIAMLDEAMRTHCDSMSLDQMGESYAQNRMDLYSNWLCA